jgi:hypothetical protein
MFSSHLYLGLPSSVFQVFPPNALWISPFFGTWQNIYLSLNTIKYKNSHSVWFYSILCSWVSYLLLHFPSFLKIFTRVLIFHTYSLKHFLYPHSKIHETTTAVFFPCNSQDVAYFCIYNIFQFRCSSSVIIVTKLRVRRLTDHDFITVMGQVFLCSPECSGVVIGPYTWPITVLNNWTSGDVCNVEQTISNGVLCVPFIIRFQGTHINVISFVPSIRYNVPWADFSQNRKSLKKQLWPSPMRF